MTESARGAHRGSDGFDAFEVDGAGPMSIALQRRTDNNRIGMLQHDRGVFRGDAGSDNDGQFGRTARGGEIGSRSFASGGFAGDNDGVRPEKFRSLDRE